MHLFPSPYRLNPQACEGLGQNEEARFSIFIVVSALLHLLVLCSCIDWCRDTAGPLLAGNTVIEIDLVSIPGPEPAAASEPSIALEGKKTAREPAPQIFETSPNTPRGGLPATIVEKPPPPAEHPASQTETPAPVEEKARTPVETAGASVLPSSRAEGETQRSETIPAATGTAGPVNSRDGARTEDTVAANTTGTSDPATAAASSGGLSPGQEYVDENFYYVKDLITRNLTYPVVARRMKWQGTVVVSFVVLENGRVEDIRIVTGSGHSVLDKNVVATIKKVQPLPAPPAAAEFTMPIKYTLKP
jgi:protein TonB